MNSWYDRYKNHKVHTELAEIDALIAAATPPIQDTTLLASYERLVHVLRAYISFVKALDPNRTTPQYLDQLVNTLPELRSNLAAFIKTGNAANLNTANTQADLLLPRFSVVPLPVESAELSQAARDYARQVDNLISNLSEKAKTVEGTLVTLSARASSSDAKLTQLDATIEGQKGRLDKAIADFQKQFSDSEATRRKQIEETERGFNTHFVQFKETINKEIRVLIDAQKTELSQLSQQLNERAKQIIAEMEAKKDAAAKVLNVSTNVAVTGNYGKYAAHEKIEAEVFRGIALVFMCGLIYGAFKTIEVALHAQQIDWRLLLVRAITTFTLAIPAFYAVRESNKHRIAEYRYRKMQLELSSVDPYLELLDKPQRDKIKEKLSEKFFAQPDVKDDTTNVDAGSLLDILKQIVMTLIKK